MRPRRWMVEKEHHRRGWEAYTTSAHRLGGALRIGMEHQLRDYLSHYRLRHTTSGDTIPLDELLRFEISLVAKTLVLC